MSVCFVTTLCALAGYVFLLASLCAFDRPATWSDAIIVDPLLPGAEQSARNIA